MCVCVLYTLSLRACLHLCVRARATVARSFSIHHLHVCLSFRNQTFGYGGAVSLPLVFSAFHRACTHAQAHAQAHTHT